MNTGTKCYCGTKCHGNREYMGGRSEGGAWQGVFHQAELGKWPFRQKAQSKQRQKRGNV
jgi:hypothetical protein